MVEESRSDGEIMRNARRLVKIRGNGALDFANEMAERMKKSGDENNLAFWERIAAQADLLLYEPPPD